MHLLLFSSQLFGQWTFDVSRNAAKVSTIFFPFQKIVTEFVTEFRHKTRLWRKSVTIFRHNSLLWRTIVTDFLHNLWRLVAIPSQFVTETVTISPVHHNFSNHHHQLESLLAKLWRTVLSQSPSQLSIGSHNVRHKKIVTERVPSQKFHHKLLWRTGYRHNLSVTIVTGPSQLELWPMKL